MINGEERRDYFEAREKDKRRKREEKKEGKKRKQEDEQESKEERMDQGGPVVEASASSTSWPTREGLKGK